MVHVMMDVFYTSGIFIYLKNKSKVSGNLAALTLTEGALVSLETNYRRVPVNLETTQEASQLVSKLTETRGS